MMNEAVKVLSLVSYKFLPPDMGGQKGIAFFNRYLAKLVNLICVTVEENTGHSENYLVKSIISNSKLRYVNLFYFFTIRKIIKDEKITHLIIEHPYYGWLGILLKWSCNIKLIVHSHNIESLRFKSMGKWWWGILWNYEKYTHLQAHHNFFIHADDRMYAIENFKLNPGKCTVVTYGFEHAAIPSAEEKKASRQTICDIYKVPPNGKILLFNGTLGYKPNLNAVDIILNEINPLLLAAEGFTYRIIICGNKLPVAYNGLTNYKDKHIIYAGFVDDINLFFKGADIFINPVMDGGGIKTKLVEALGYNCSVISTKSGAIGIPSEVAGNKMKIIEDNNWQLFAESIINLQTDVDTATTFFEHFYWGNIAGKAAGILNNI